MSGVPTETHHPLIDMVKTYTIVLQECEILQAAIDRNSLPISVTAQSIALNRYVVVCMGFTQVLWRVHCNHMEIIHGISLVNCCCFMRFIPMISHLLFHTCSSIPCHFLCLFLTLLSPHPAPPSHKSICSHMPGRLLQSFTNTLQEVTLASLPDSGGRSYHAGKAVQLHSFTDNTKRTGGVMEGVGWVREGR